MGRYNIIRLKNIFWLRLAKNFPCTGQQRALIVRLGGVVIKDYKTTFIGENVIFDTYRPDLITVGNMFILQMDVLYSRIISTLVLKQPLIKLDL